MIPIIMPNYPLWEKKTEKTFHLLGKHCRANIQKWVEGEIKIKLNYTGFKF